VKVKVWTTACWPLTVVVSWLTETFWASIFDNTAPAAASAVWLRRWLMA